MGIGARWERADAWRRRLVAELIVLPQTLSDLREGVDNFRRVSQRMLDATTPLDQVNELQNSAWADLRARIETANRAVREQVGAVPGGERMAGAIEDLNQSLAALARLNPFWPRSFPRDPPN